MKNVEVSAENFQKSVVAIGEIKSRISQVYKDTAAFSTSNHIYNHPKFKEVVEMGDQIVPFICHEIVEEGNHWIYLALLQQITKVHPPKEIIGRFIHLTIFWLQWFIDSDYYKNDDIYHGLHDFKSKNNEGEKHD